MPDLSLRHDLTFADLHTRDGLMKVDAAFLDTLPPDIADKLREARRNPPQGKDSTALLLELAPHVEDFVADLFGIQPENARLQDQHATLAPLYRVKRLFVQRRAAKETVRPDDVPSPPPPRDELTFARDVSGWLADESAHAGELAEALRYAAWALHTPEGRARHAAGILFHLPPKTDPAHLVPFTRQADGCIAGETFRARAGFDLTDPGATLEKALDETHYCIWCAHQGKDSCSKGLRDRTTGTFQRNTHGVTLAGCPLEEKISEFHELKSQGLSIAALAVITVDNPMVAGTGHRICNDCVKACIFQKQKPVDIPQAETRTLKDVLSLPWGVEIYSLLTRWNPLNFARFLPLPETGRSVLVAGLGPAGYTLAHHLMNDGHHVFAIDGLKIEPLPEGLLTTPVREMSTLWEPLSERISGGFGGVAEYGITARWDKNFLTLIRLLLQRRDRFAYAGGVRLGGTITLDDAFAAGFDHVALCLGAGRPTLIPLPNGLARGVRQASDFLMALQLTGAAKADSLANLEIRLPIVVIGGGLTAIDTATEALAYYPVQVEKFLRRVEAVGEEAFLARLTEEERQTADTFLTHARALRAAPSPSARRALLEAWGGATIAYRRTLHDAPSYTLNHEEVTLALEEGIRILDEATPKAVEVDAFGHATALMVRHPERGEVRLPAGSVLVAAGTQPNTVLAREDSSLVLDGKYFRAVDERGAPIQPERSSKPAVPAVLMHTHKLSFFGDLHPGFAGNVVKAMASAKQGAPVLSAVLARHAPASPDPKALLTRMQDDLSATVQSVTRLTDTIVEIKVRAPRAARRFQPGQFYRLQNFERSGPDSGSSPRLPMEGIALTGAAVEGDVVSLIVLEMGGSTSLCTHLQRGEPVVLMGPTGAPTVIPTGETVLLIGGGLGNAVLFSIGAACRAAGNRVLYFAGYKKRADRYKVAEIEAAADRVVWCCDEAPGFTPSRPGDLAVTGTLIDGLKAYGDGTIGDGTLRLQEVDRLLCIGSDGLMAAVARARAPDGLLGAVLKPGHTALGSINAPMQCMMKEICAQCLQRTVDPVTGREQILFTCAEQDQPLDRVDFANLHQRLRQNSLSEKLTAAWITHLKR